MMEDLRNAALANLFDFLVKQVAISPESQPEPGWPNREVILQMMRDFGPAAAATAEGCINGLRPRWHLAPLKSRAGRISAFCLKIL